MRLPSLPRNTSPRSARRDPVLFVGPNSIEWWFDGADGRSYHLEQPFASLRPEEVVETALSAVQEQGGVPKTCVLALASELGSEAMLRLPDLTPTEAKEVLNRRAVQVLEADPGDVLYHAVPLAEDSGQGAESVSRSWLLYTQRRSLVLGLQLELRRRGVDTSRAVVARSAFAARSAEAAVPVIGTERAWIFVGVEKQHTIYGLGVGDNLLLQSLLETGLGPESPAAVLGLVQELRNLSAWWRKRSRGAALGAIVTIGLEPDLAASMEPALRAAFGAVEFVHVKEPGSEAMMSRVSTLAACRSQHQLTSDVTQPLPVSTRGFATVAVVTTALCALVAAWFHHRWTYRIEEAGNELAQLRFLGSEARTWHRDLNGLEAREENLELLTEELEGLSRRGIPLEALLTNVDQAFVGDAHLSTLTVGEGETGFRVQMSAKALGDPDDAADLLAEVQRTLALGHVFTERPRILPPTALPTREANSELVFSVEGVLPDHGRVASTEDLP